MLSPFRKHIRPFDRAQFLHVLEDFPLLGVFRLIAIILFFGLILWVCIYATAPSD
jgi:hypothetical protein